MRVLQENITINYPIPLSQGGTARLRGNLKMLCWKVIHLCRHAILECAKLLLTIITLGCPRYVQSLAEQFKLVFVMRKHFCFWGSRSLYTVILNKDQGPLRVFNGQRTPPCVFFFCLIVFFLSLEFTLVFQTHLFIIIYDYVV